MITDNNDLFESTIENIDFIKLKEHLRKYPIKEYRFKLSKKYNDLNYTKFVYIKYEDNKLKIEF